MSDSIIASPVKAVARWARALDLSGTLPGAHAPGFTMPPASAGLEPKALQSDRPAAAGLEPKASPRVKRFG